ncbi:MAG: hypothetical protein K2M52_00140 [Paramuribaculum sp.]|nr:hypothetical protein [Paramuribaculum sp.]
MKNIFTLAVIIYVSLFASANNNDANGIRVGQCDIKIRVVHSDFPLDSVEAWVQTSPIFSGLFENETFHLSLQDSSFVGQIPTETINEIVGVTFQSGEKGTGRLFAVKQDTENVFDVNISRDFVFDWGTTPDSEGLTVDDWFNISSGVINFYSFHNLETPIEKYLDWRSVREYENDTLWQKNLEVAGLLPAYPSWIENSLRCRFASNVTMPYVKRAEIVMGIEVEEPPMESYSFLNTISYDDSFLKRVPVTGLKSYLYALLRFPDGGFSPIKDESVREWQSHAGAKMSKVIPQPTQLLLDLLSAMSYVEQIEIQQSQLTETQIENVTNGYRDGLKDIILAKNNKLKARLSKTSEFIDLTDTTFLLKQYIDSVYPGKAVIVDMWGTWCMPCLDAIAQTEYIRTQNDFKDIVFLYIATETTPYQDWIRKATDINGEHIRINNNDTEVIGKEYNLTGFPSYLFFTPNHELLKACTAFPGTETYIRLANSLGK